jgi:hypothetical protein
MFSISIQRLDLIKVKTLFSLYIFLRISFIHFLKIEIISSSPNPVILEAQAYFAVNLLREVSAAQGVPGSTILSPMSVALQTIKQNPRSDLTELVE